MLEMNPIWFSALSCNILTIKLPIEDIDEVVEETDTVRDEEVGKKFTKVSKFQKFVAFVYYKHFQLTVTFWRAYLYMF